MSGIVQIPGNADPVLVVSSTGVGASATTFTHDTAGENQYPGQLYPAVFEFAITDIVGVFSALSINLEWSPITFTGTPQFQTVGTWTPLVSPVVYFPCSATGQYRLNVTSFTGGTSFNVYASIASTMPQGSGGGGGGGSVTQGTVPWVVSFIAPQHVIVDSGAGSGVQFADNAASGATPTGTLAMGWDSVNSKIRALKVDASQNLLVDVSNASIAVTGTFFQATQPVSIAATVNVAQTGSPWGIIGTIADGSTTETNILIVGGESNDATAQYQPIPLGAAGRSVIVEGVAGGTVVPVSLTSTTITGTVAENLTQVASTVLGVPQTFGTAPIGVVIGTSSDIYIAGTRARSNQTTTAAGVQDVNLVGALGVTMSVTNPLFSSITDGTTKAGVIVATTALKTDLSSVAGTATVVATAGVQLVGIEGRAGTSLETTAGVLDENIKNVGNSAVVTAAAGVQKVGIVGNAAATLDSTIGAATAPTNALATLVVYQTTVPSLTAGQAVAAQCDVAGSHFVNIAGRIPTYSAVANSTTTPTFTAVAGDIAVLPGSASKTIRVTRIEVTLSTSGTATIETVSLIKRSAADTGGTSSAMTIVPHDSRFGGATAAPLLYTAAPTPGAAVGFIRATQFNDQSATVPGSATWIWTFGDGRGGAAGLTLNGVAQEICINLGGVVATQTAAVSFEWTEDNS